MSDIQKLKIGFIGVGGIAREGHLKHLSHWDDVALVAFCDVNEEVADRAVREYGGAAYTSAKRMLDEVSLDAVYVCLPPFAHTNQEILAAQRGVALFVEKPLAVDLAKAAAIHAAIEKAGVVSAVGYNWRSTEITQIARKRMAGKSVSTAFAYWIGGMPGVMWWRQQAQSGGQMNEQAIHVVDIARHLIGAKAVSVHGQGTRGIGAKKWEKHDIYDHIVATITFDNGAVLCAGTGHLAPGGFRTGVDFLLDELVVTHNNSELIVRTPDREEKIRNTNKPYAAEDRAFLDAVRSGNRRAVYCSYADAFETHRITMAINESVESGQVVSL
ncbi:Gfo/Idh/MocA family protein [Candidatus Entotheonella palauensis]|uniref:Gfo/Idh/MocA family protein n=1 Tax=Candidatus Entotheonella palauensis TaxID=93172 RepID=UPI000B7F7263|nr:Gfo/Idh/MocA family oxidoreductase [Candidatus Entotheonella palauensis]